MDLGIWVLTKTAIYQRVRKTIERHALFGEGSRVLIGLSGGSDSVALLFLLRELAEHGGFTVAGLAHLNHQLRPAAERDEVFCRELAGRLGLRIVVKSENVKGYARGRNLSVEDAARRVRYDFMGKAADTLGAEHIAVGHTQDDQAETFLLKALRTGAGHHEIGLDHVEAAMAALVGAAGGVDIPGGRVELRRGKLVLIQQKPLPK